MTDSFVLRDGTMSQDRRLDRLQQFDPRSRAYPIRALAAGRPPRSYTWRCAITLDQGYEGACVGFAMAHELAARPAEVRGLTNADARGIYKAAQKLDPWEGEAYSGTSVLAGVKAAQALGYFKSYRWAFGLDDLVLGLGYNGPVVLGLNWYAGMYEPDANGFIHPNGPWMGGHAILARAVNVQDRTVTLHNSWGAGWGSEGGCRIGFDDLGRLLHEGGEAVFLLDRKAAP